MTPREPSDGGADLPALELGRERRIDPGEHPAALGGRQSVEEGDPGEKRVVAASGRLGRG